MLGNFLANDGYSDGNNLGIRFLLKMGMAPTINREVARCSAPGDLKEADNLLHTLAVVYWFMAGAIALLIMAR